MELKMNRLLVRICFAITMCIVLVRTEVKVENGGYSNVLVSFSSNVPSTGNKILLDNLKASLEDTSELLNNAIGLRITKVTVLIPKDWDISDLNVTVENHSGSKADILVDAANDTAFGNLPLALQYGSCGTPGHQIIIPANYLNEENSTFPKGTALAREWLKYRYGVFDENGYPGDELYPLYYSIPGYDPSELKVTECSNKPISYDFIDTEGNNCTHEDDQDKCRMDPIEESLENVTSSLMYFHEKIPGMQHVCGKDPEHSHSSLSRNKHNALCGGRSVWDVLKNSTDFQSPSASLADGEEVIEFNYVQEAKLKVVIALENSHNLANQGLTARNAVKKFVYDLPKGSKYSLFPYTDKEVKADFSLRELNNWPVDWKTEIIANFDKKEDGNVTSAVDKALQILAADNPSDTELEGTIIIISASPIKDDEDLRKRLESSKVCLIFFLFSDAETPSEYTDYVSYSKCGTLVEVSKDDKNATVLEKMFSAMGSMLPEIVDDSVTETVKIENLLEGESTSFSVDATVEKVTFWLIPGKEPEAIHFTFNDEQVHPEVEVGSDIVALSFSPNQNGTIVMKNEYGTALLTQIRTTSKPGQYFSGDVFVHDTTSTGSETQMFSTSTQMPVILYARVRFGAYPVQNAEVRAKVTGPNGENVELTMYDDGRGNPDITENDGVYSRYFTSFSGKGDYTVTVTVQNNSVLTFGGNSSGKGYQPCCGSSIEKGTLDLPEFTKTFTTTFHAVSGRPEEGYKPSRIVDLRIESVEDNKVVLTWTAPGAEADEGTVESYDIKYFTSQEEVQNFESGKSIGNEIPPQQQGSTEKHEVDFSNFGNNVLCYIAIQAKNDTKNSETSNIVQVFIPDHQTTTIHEDTTSSDKLASTKKKTIGIVVGVILGVIVLAIITYLIVYFAVLKPKRNKKEKKSQEDRANRPTRPNRPTQPHHTTQSSTDSHALNPINFVSADTLIKHHNEKTKAKNENKEPPILKEEDFEENSTSKRDEDGSKKNNMEQPRYGQVSHDSKNSEPLPPKSPKRTTFV